MESVFDRWVEGGNAIADLVVVCDNAPCHNGLGRLFEDSPAQLLKLGPYSPMLNPMESIWSKIKANVKTEMRIPAVHRPGVGEQRIAYVEDLVRNAVAAVTNGDCARAAQHTTTFHNDVMEMQDMGVGV